MIKLGKGFNVVDTTDRKISNPEADPNKLQMLRQASKLGGVVISFGVLVSLLCGCAQNKGINSVAIMTNANTQPTITETYTSSGELSQTETASSTVTSIPTEKAVTPEVAQPTVSQNLLPVNNASEVWENNAWVVKNTDGKVTATWDATENKWVYDAENIKIMFEGAANPSTQIGSDGAVNKHFDIPQLWETPLSSDQIDPKPLVPSGIINEYQYYDDLQSKSGLYNVVEVGVDFRGIVLAEPIGTILPDGSTTKNVNIYVAGFTVIDPSHPDLMYLINIPIYESTDGSTNFDLNPAADMKGSAFTVRTNMDDPDLYSLMNPQQLIQVLKQYSSVGRRMVIDLQIPVDGQKYTNDIYIFPENKTFIDSLSSGQSVSNIETTATIESIHLPKDLNINIPHK
jgi:hypothetical protein